MSGGREAEAAAEVPRFVSRPRRPGPARALDPVEGRSDPAGGHLLLRLPPPVVAAVRRMGAVMAGIGPAEVVRRGLILLDFALSLGHEEELVVRNRRSGRCDRLTFSWDAAPGERRSRIGTERDQG